MPRKPKSGPPILKIERLSDGIDPTAVDDFTQEPLVQPNAKPPRIDDAQAERDRLNRLKASAALQVLESALRAPKPKPQGKLVRRI